MEWKDLFCFVFIYPFVDLVFWTLVFVACDCEMFWVELKMERFPRKKKKKKKERFELFF